MRDCLQDLLVALVLLGERCHGYFYAVEAAAMEEPRYLSPDCSLAG